MFPDPWADLSLAWARTLILSCRSVKLLVFVRIITVMDPVALFTANMILIDLTKIFHCDNSKDRRKLSL